MNFNMEQQAKSTPAKATPIKDLINISKQYVPEKPSHKRRLKYEFTLDDKDDLNFAEDERLLITQPSQNEDNPEYDEMEDDPVATPYYAPRKREAKTQKIKSKQKQKELILKSLPQNDIELRTNDPSLHRKRTMEKLSVIIPPFVYIPSFQLTKNDKIVAYLDQGILNESARPSDLFGEDSDGEVESEIGRSDDKSLSSIMGENPPRDFPEV